MKSGSVLAIIACTGILLSSCTQRILDFTLISSKNIDLNKACTFVKGKSRVEGKDLAHWIIIVPTKFVHIKNAVDKAIESTPGCVALVDGVIYSKFWWIPYVYGQESFVVEGTPLIDPSLTKGDITVPDYGKIELDKSGKVKSINYISADEYYSLREKIAKGTPPQNFTSSDNLKGLD